MRVPRATKQVTDREKRRTPVTGLERARREQPQRECGDRRDRMTRGIAQLLLQPCGQRLDLRFDLSGGKRREHAARGPSGSVERFADQRSRSPGAGSLLVLAVQGDRVQ